MQGIRPSLAGFEGRWRVTRRIQDARAGQEMMFQGEAVFSPGQGEMLYRESGTMTAPGLPAMQATRHYRWSTLGDDIAVFFEDGRPFHLIAPGCCPQAHHDCPPDDYDVAYDFSGWPLWTSTWTVSGPRKTYVSETTYERLA